MGNRDIWDEIELAGTGEHLDEEMFEYLSAYADGECSAKERRLVEAYLAESAEARAQLAELRMQSAMSSEGMVDPPEWLRKAILAKTVEKRSLRWPFAAGFATAAAGAVALAIYVSQPIEVEAPTSKLLATNDIEGPSLVEPPTAIPDSRTEPQSVVGGEVTREANPIMPASRPSGRPEATTIQTARTIAEKPIVSRPTPQPAPAEKKPDPEVTYAVVEHRSGSFESKQPDVFDSEPLSAEPTRTSANAAPAVLPDAREKLRDKVRKINQEKLEIEGTEK